MRTLALALLFLSSLYSHVGAVQSEKTSDASQRTASVDPEACQPREHLSEADFEAVMQTIREAWSEGNAQRAASCFGQDAIYSVPPSTAVRGRENLYEYFGGAKGPAVRMKVEWHHLVFDPGQGLGAGEFTFNYHLQTHGVVIVKFKNGLINNWREYPTPSDLPWPAFVGVNSF